MSEPNYIFSPEAQNALMGNGAEQAFKISEYDISIEAYMCSKKGINSETNSDNYYLNGLCEKSFKFIDIQKPYEGVTVRCGVFAVGSGIATDKASKMLVRFLDDKKEFLTASKSVANAKKRLSEVINYCNKRLIDESYAEKENFESSLAIAVYIKEYVVFAVCGEAKLLNLKNNGIKMIEPSCGNLGVVDSIKPFIGKIAFSENDNLILLSKGASANMSLENVVYNIFKEKKPRVIAEYLLNNISYRNSKDCTCMAINAKPTKCIRTKTLIIAGVALLWTLVNIFMLILME